MLVYWRRHCNCPDLRIRSPLAADHSNDAQHTAIAPAMAIEFAEAGIRSVRSTSSVPHPTNAIPLDDILAAALRGELNGSSFPGRAP